MYLKYLTDTLRQFVQIWSTSTKIELLKIPQIGLENNPLVLIVNRWKHTIRNIHIVHKVGDGVKDPLKFFRAVPVSDVADTLQDLDALGNFLNHIDRHGSERFVQPLATLEGNET